MKILYVALKYDYGKNERGLSFEHYNFYDSLVKMDGGRHQVIHFAFDEVMKAVGRDQMNEQLKQIAGQLKPDLCFFFLYLDEIKKETIRYITNDLYIKTFNWFADDHFRFYNFSRYYAPCFSLVSTTDSNAIAKYAKARISNVIKTQWACNHFLYKPQPSSERYDISFVGAPHSNRREIVETISAKGLNIQCFGSGWPNGRISQEKMIEVFGNSKINLNFSQASGNLSLKSLAKIFISRNSQGYSINTPLSWHDNYLSFIGGGAQQIKGRVFEVCGCGGLLMTEKADNLSEYYIPEKEVVVFSNKDDLLAKLEFYLANDQERQKIALAGHQRTIVEHTYEKRFQEIFNKMNLK